MAEEGSTPPTTVEDAPAVVEDAPAKVEEPAADTSAEPAAEEAAPAAEEAAPAAEEAAPAAEEAAPAAEEAAPAAEEAAPAAEEAAPAAEEAAPAADDAAPAADDAAPAADDPAPASEEAAPAEAAIEETAEPFPEILSTKSLVAKHVTEDVWKKLSAHKTATSGFTLSKAIACAVQYDDQNCGIYAGDWDSYKDFSAVFDPIIQDYHGISADSKHTTDMDVSKITGNIDAEAPVKSTRIRVGRSVDGFGLSPGILKEHRLEFEEMMKTVFSKLEGDLAGTYYPLTGMEEATRQQLVDDHFLFMSGDKNLITAGMERDWPEGRGIFHNATKTFLVWVNEEDQLRIISMAQGSDVRGVFELLVKGINAIEDCIKTDFNKSIMLDEKYGYIHSCPTNLGTGMRASVHVDLPGYTKEGLATLKKRCEELHLQPRGTRGESGGHIDATYDISNKHRLGYSEVELVQKLIDGVNTLVKEDREIMEDLSPKEPVAAEAPVEAVVESEAAVTDVDSGPAAEVTAPSPPLTLLSEVSVIVTDHDSEVVGEPTTEAPVSEPASEIVTETEIAAAAAPEANEVTSETVLDIEAEVEAAPEVTPEVVDEVTAPEAETTLEAVIEADLEVVEVEASHETGETEIESVVAEVASEVAAPPEPVLGLSDEPASEAPASSTPVEADTPVAATEETPVAETPAEAAPAEPAPAEEAATEEPVTAVEPAPEAPAAPAEPSPDAIGAAEPTPPAPEADVSTPAPQPVKKTKFCSIL